MDICLNGYVCPAKTMKMYLYLCLCMCRREKWNRKYSFSDFFGFIFTTLGGDSYGNGMCILVYIHSILCTTQRSCWVLKWMYCWNIHSTSSILKKTAVSRSWILLDRDGRDTLWDVDKYAIMRLVDINARDLQILDPLLSYPSTILGREKVIVLNLEVTNSNTLFLVLFNHSFFCFYFYLCFLQHIKAIITAEEVRTSVRHQHMSEVQKYTAEEV